MKDTDSHYMFNYDHMTEEQKLAAEECAKLCEQTGAEISAKFIRQQFKLEELPKKSIDDSVFCKIVTAAGLYYAVQGYKRINDTLIPVVALTEDIDTLDKLAIYIKNIQPTN